MPVYNGEKYLRGALDSLLSQTFSDFELIISDNASTDNSGSICLEYASKDNRIRYIRQPDNIGAAANFKFVFDATRGEYFMWAACDDVRSSDFIEVNLEFLKSNADYVASTSPNGFEGVEPDKQTMVDFKLDGDLFERFTEFFKYCWVSHGIFYSLIRTSALRNCPVVGQSFYAADWAINLYLASKGKLNRTESGYTIIGIKGISSGSESYRAFRNEFIELFVPFYRLGEYVRTFTAGLNAREKIRITFILIKLNIRVDFDRTLSWLYSIYCKFFGPMVRKKQLAK